MRPPHERRQPSGGQITRLIGALAVVGVAWAAAATAGDPAVAEKPRLAVSVSVLGVEGGSTTPAVMVAALAEGGWCEPKAVAATRWNQRPEAAGDARWLSVVLAGFGGRAQAVAFLFDADGSAPRLVARVPYVKTFNPQANTYHWVVPTGWITFAIRDFFANTAKAPPAAAVPTGLVVRERVDERTADKGTAGLAGLSGTRNASNIDAVKALPAVEALLAAAMLESGLVPGPADAAARIEADVRFGVKVGSFRIAHRGGKAAVERSADDVPEDEYFDHLLRTIMMLAAKPGGGVADFFRPDGGGPLQLLAASPDRLAVAGGDGLTIFDVVSGQRVHPASNPRGLTHVPGRYVGRDAATGGTAIFRLDGGLSRIDAATGAASGIAADSPGRAWGFAVAGRGAVVASDRVLAAYAGGTAAAWRQEEPATIAAGPAEQGDAVFVGLADGGLVCRGLADGAERWRKGTPQESWHGPMACVAGRVLAYDRIGRSLTAFDATDGRMAWKQPLGDVLLQPPSQVGDTILVVAKNNRLLVLAPSDGTVVAEVRWPTWLSDVVAIPGRRPLVACADIHGDIGFLDAATLQTSATVRLPARLSGPLLFHPSFPSSLGRSPRDSGDEAEDLADELDRTIAVAATPIPALLASDVEGFCYVVRVPTD
jgi:hypothetical protein